MPVVELSVVVGEVQSVTKFVISRFWVVLWPFPKLSTQLI